MFGVCLRLTVINEHFERIDAGLFRLSQLGRLIDDLVENAARLVILLNVDVVYVLIAIGPICKCWLDVNRGENRRIAKVFLYGALLIAREAAETVGRATIVKLLQEYSTCVAVCSRIALPLGQ